MTVAADGLTVDDLEDVLLELNKYEKQSSVEIPSLLESYLKFVAKSGSTHFPWNKIKRLFRDKLEQVFNEFFEASPIDEIPPTPNVDIFNFANVKVSGVAPVAKALKQAISKLQHQN